MYSFLKKDEPAYRRPLTKFLHYIDFESGGLLASEEVSKPWKVLWIIQQIGTPLLITGSGIAYLFTQPKMHLHTVLYTLYSSGIMFNSMLIILGWTRCGEKIKTFITTADEKFIEYQANPEECKHLAGRLHSWIEVLSSRKLTRMFIPLLPTAVALIKFCTTLFLDDSKMQNISGYLYAFPGLQEVNDWPSYIVGMILQIITFVPPIITDSLITLFIVLFTMELGKEFVLLEEDIKMDTEKFEQRMSTIYEQEGKLQKNPIKIFAKKRRLCCEEFVRSVDKHVQRHRLLIKTISLFKPFLEYYFSVSISTLTMALIPTGFLILEPIGESRTYLLETAVTLAGLSLANILECFIGQSFRDMGKGIEKAVYSMPWYELTPQQRKVVHLFLCQTQRTINFNALKIYPISMELVPKILNFVYSQVVGLQTIRNKK